MAKIQDGRVHDNTFSPFLRGLEVAINRFYVFFRRYRLIPPIKTLPAEEPGKYGVTVEAGILLRKDSW